MVYRKECNVRLMNYLFLGFPFAMFAPRVVENSEIKTTDNGSSTYVKNGKAKKNYNVLMLLFPVPLKTETVQKLYLLKLVLFLLHPFSKDNCRVQVQKLAYKIHVSIHKLVNRISTIGSFLNNHASTCANNLHEKGKCIKQFALLIFYVYGCFPACMSVHHLCACCSQRPRKGIGSPGNGLTDGCEL